MTIYLALILLLPLLGGLFNILAGHTLPRRVGESVACGAIIGAFACSLLAFRQFSAPQTVVFVSWLSAFDFQAPLALYVDQLSLTLILMITFVCGLIHLYSVGYMRNEPDFARYFALLNLFVCAMLVLVLAGNLPLLYLGWEGVGFCSYALIGFWYGEENNATAGRKAFIVTRVGDMAFGIAIVWMYQLTATLSIPQLNAAAATMPAGSATLLGILLLLGAAGKSAQLPLSVWLPDAMAGPTPVSAQIHAATMVTAGVYLLARMFPLIGGSETVRTAIALTGGLTAFYAATCACAQRDLKRILAYSTISQIGYMVMGVGVGALTAATFHLLTHAFFKALLFLAAGCVITALHHQQDIFRMGGLRSRIPSVYWPFLAGALCLAGFPLTGGFFSKDAILGAVFNKGGSLSIILFSLGLLTALLTAFYTFRMVLVVFHGTGLRQHDTHETSLLPPVMTITLFPLALLGICGGLINLPDYLPGHGLLSSFLGLSPPLHAGDSGAPGREMALQVLAAAVSIAGIGIAWYRYGGNRRSAALTAEQAASPHGFLLNAWHLDALYRMLFIDPFVRLSRFLWKGIDEGSIDRALDGLADRAVQVARIPSWWSSGRVATALYGLGGGIALVLAYMAWVLI